MAQKVLITGISGFAGSYLAEYLIAKRKYKIFGTYLINSGLNNIAHIKDILNLVEIDLRNAGKVRESVRRIKPDLVFHLAAFPSPAESFKDPTGTIINNVTVQINLLEAIKECNLHNCRVLVVSSADVYGKVSKRDIPIDENTPLMPTNPYAVSKITQDFLALQYFISYQMQVVRVRPFNHIGPRQSPSFVVSSFAKKIAEIEHGARKPVLGVGNLSTKRDFTDVRDIVEGYVRILEKGLSGEVYNIGSGISYKIAHILDMLLSYSKKKIVLQENPVFFRPYDSEELRCDYRKLREITNWEPKISIKTTLKETLDYWRNIV